MSEKVTFATELTRSVPVKTTVNYDDLNVSITTTVEAIRKVDSSGVARTTLVLTREKDTPDTYVKEKITTSLESIFTALAQVGYTITPSHPGVHAEPGLTTATFIGNPVGLVRLIRVDPQ